MCGVNDRVCFRNPWNVVLGGVLMVSYCQSDVVGCFNNLSKKKKKTCMKLQMISVISVRLPLRYHGDELCRGVITTDRRKDYEHVLREIDAFISSAKICVSKHLQHFILCFLRIGQWSVNRVNVTVPSSSVNQTFKVA